MTTPNALTQTQAMELAKTLAERWCNVTMDGTTKITDLADEGDCIGYRTHWESDYEDPATATFTVVRQEGRFGWEGQWAVVEQGDDYTILHLAIGLSFPIA